MFPAGIAEFARTFLLPGFRPGDENVARVLFAALCWTYCGVGYMDAFNDPVSVA